jgi:hypothetical protein
MRAVRVADSGGEDRDRVADVVHDLARPVRHRAGLGNVHQSRGRFGRDFLVLVVLAHHFVVRRGDGPVQARENAPVLCM